jgi:hypothetical protein
VTTQKVPTPQAIAGGVSDLVVGSLAIFAGALSGRLTTEEPLPPFVVGTLLTMGVLYVLAGIILLLPWRVAFLMGRVVLLVGVVVNLFLALSGGFAVPREFILEYPLVVAAPGALVGLTMLEAIVLFWPGEGSR